MKNFRILLILLFLPMLSKGQTKEGIMTFPPGYESFRIDTVLKVYVDSTQELEIEDILKLQDTFVSLGQLPDELSLKEDLWARLKVKNTRKDSISLIWPTGSGDFIEIFHFRNGKLLFPKKGGRKERVPDRNIKVGRGDALGIILAPGEQRELFIKKHEVEGNGPRINPYLVLNSKYAANFYSQVFQNIALLHVFYGILAIIIIYNLIMGFSMGEWMYFFYSFYLFSIGYTIFLENTAKYFPQYAFPEPYWNRVFIFLFFSMTAVSYLQFGRLFLNTREITPRWDKAIKSLIIIRLSVTVVGILLAFLHFYFPPVPSPSDSFFKIILGLMAIEAAFMLVYFFPLVKSESNVAWFFVAGSSLVFLVGFVGILIQNIFGINFFTYILLSIVLEILVFSLGLGYKFRNNQKDKLQAEKALNLELSKVNTAFGRFVPHEFLESLGHETVTQVRLGDQVEKEVTVFFADIRGYTSLSESMTPQENFLFLNAYLGRVGPIIKEENGFVNQYFGDGIMAIFMKSASDAVNSAIQIQQTLKDYNEERAEKGRQPIKIGIGLHTGPLMMGIIGDQLRMDAAVVSDTVNTASRMEGLTKHYGADLILSETVLAQLPEDHAYKLRYLGKVLVKGRRQPLDIYECLDASLAEVRNAKLELLEAFQTGLNAYFSQNFADACKHFQELVDKNSADVAAKFYLEKAQNHLINGVEESWNGVETMMSK